MPELTTFGETMLRFSPPPGERLERATELEVRTGGAESNVAIVAANLGRDVAWLSKLPASPLGRRVERDLLANGVEPAVAWAASPPSRVGTYYLDPGGDPRGTDVIYDRAGSAVTTTTIDDLDLDLVREASFFATSGITPALSDTLYETTAALLQVAKDAGTSTVFDVNYRAKLWSAADAGDAMERLLPMADIVAVSEHDARTVLGYDGHADGIATELRAAVDAELVLLTCGDEGAVAADGETLRYSPAFTAETVDPIGTGDAFLGGFVAARLAGEALAEALEAAAATAALSRTMKGDWATITTEEVERVRDGKGGLSR